MEQKNLTRISRYISLLLRHSPEQKNLKMDEYGYVSVKQLCDALKITKQELDWIVENNNKKRFSYKNKKKEYIRACQGHSVNVKLELKEAILGKNLPDILFHGTTTDNYDNIMKNGLQKMKRHDVHLTNDYKSATEVGLRYAKNINKLVVFNVDVKAMINDGLKFYVSDNMVYFTNQVPSKYLTPKIAYENSI